MIEISCPHADEWTSFLLGQTPEPDAEYLERHLTRCSSCLEATKALEPIDPLLVSVQHALRTSGGPLIEVNEDLIERMRRLELSTNNIPCPSLPATAHGAVANEIENFGDLLAPSDEPDEQGRIGPFGILRVLGRGGMGVVFLAREQRPRRVVALKMFQTGSRAGRHGLERFRSESDTMARLRHPNVVRVLAVGEHNGRPYFTTEYAEGGSLAQKLAAAPLTARQAAELTRTLASTVQAAHEQGVIHRDLKPSNVLLSADGTPLIADFGLAKQLEDEEAPAAAERTQTGAILGTPSYMAPEQAAGHSNKIGPAADVYALGAILYECLTGRPPFKSASMLETLEQVRTQEPVSPGRLQPNLPRDLQTICLKCLEKEPRRRYASAGALADDLTRFLDARPVFARPVRSWERAWKWACRQPALAALVCLSILSVVALIAGIALHNVQLRIAVDRADTYATESDRQQQLARASYRKARDTLDKMLEQFAGYRLGELPQFRDLQRRQIEKALAFYESALDAQDDADAAVRLDTAVACKRAADLQSMLGRPAQAADNYTRAIELFEALPAEDRDTAENQFLLAACYNHRGLLANNARRWDDSARDHLKALQIMEARAQQAPGVEQWRSGVAETEHFLGAFYQVSGKPADAETHHLRSAALYTELVRDRPAEERYLAKLADNEIDLALLYQGTQRLVEAKRMCEQAEGHLLALLERRPSDGEVTLSLCALYSNWGLLLTGIGEMPAALARLTRAVDLAESVLKREPRHLTARHRAYNAHGARAQVYERLGRWSEAVADWDRAIETGVRTDAWEHRVFRAIALARAGMHARAAAEANVLAADPKVSPDGLYNVACVLSLAAEQVLSDQQIDMARRKQLAEEYSRQAMELLRRLHKQGYFKDPGHSKALETDPDLNALRKRADFPKL